MTNNNKNNIASFVGTAAGLGILMAIDKYSPRRKKEKFDNFIDNLYVIQKLKIGETIQITDGNCKLTSIAEGDASFTSDTGKEIQISPESTVGYYEFKNYDKDNRYYFVLLETNKEKGLINY